MEKETKKSLFVNFRVGLTKFYNYIYLQCNAIIKVNMF